MKVGIICFMVALGVAHGGFIPATTILRSPSHDSAIIQTDRFGGNFAYSTIEGHAYSAYSPLVQRVAQPLFSYSPHPAHLGFAHAPIIAPFYNPSSLISPTLIASHPIIGNNPAAVQAPPTQAPVDAPVPAPAPAPAADQPTQALASDEDSVSVESA